jgi:Cft2 family RNA processing exonuclease
MNSGSLRLISGVESKAPACFLLEAAGKRLLLDLGEGPPPGPAAGYSRPRAGRCGHFEPYHIGGLGLLAELGHPPVYATEPVARALPKSVSALPLPVGGRSNIFGIPVETGRNGHAPGGIWLHFHVGRGFLYTGDYCVESVLYGYDPPAQAAATALIDCSYGDYEKPLAACWSALAPFLGRGPLLLPVPANGRGPEIALELMRQGIDEICVDDAMRAALNHLGNGDGVSLRADLRDEIERLAHVAKPIDGARGVMLAASADGASSATAKLLPQFENTPEVTILFTGYVNPNTPAERLSKSGRAQTMRWNVHPRLADTVTLVQSVRAKTVIPAFCDRSYLTALATALTPARVTMDGPVAV